MGPSRSLGVIRPIFASPYMEQQSLSCDTQSRPASDLGGMDPTRYQDSSHMSGSNSPPNGYDPVDLSRQQVSSHHISPTDSVSTHEQPSPHYGQAFTWGHSSVDGDITSYSYPASLSSPRTSWPPAAQEQMHPSYTTSPSLTSASFEQYPSDSSIIAPSTTVISSEYDQSPFESSSRVVDMQDQNLTRYSSPAQQSLDEMDGDPKMERQTSPAYTEDGLSGMLSEREISTSPSTQGGADLQGQGQKQGKSYALLLYDCFMSHPEHSMTLQDIYKWFRENTEKANEDGGKGWQNSVRHNLSMNQAFVKKERHAEGADAQSPGSTPIAAESKKPSNVWVLTDWAVREGVQSTTRYRNQKHTPANRGMSTRDGIPLRNTARRSARNMRPYTSYNTRRSHRYADYPQSYGPGAPGHPLGYTHHPYQQYIPRQQSTASMIYRTGYPTMPNYQIPHSGPGSEGMRHLADAALMAQSYSLPQQQQQQSQAMGPTSNPMAQSPTPTRSDGVKTPNSMPDGLPLPEPMGNSSQQFFGGCNYPDPMEAYGVPAISGVSEKDERLWLDPVEYGHTAQVGGSWQMP